MIMNKKILTCLLLFPLLSVSCLKETLSPMDPPISSTQSDNRILPAMKGLSSDEDPLPPYATRSLINAQTSRQLHVQFLRIDEQTGTQGKGLYTFPTWDEGFLAEGSVTTSPGDQSHGYMRSVILNPIQHYANYIHPAQTAMEKADTTFYHSRLISWYPITCPLHKEEGIASSTQLKHYREANTGYNSYEKYPDGNIRLLFNNLNGETDIMVSEAREGQQWHQASTTHPSNIHPITQESIYRQPFGMNEHAPEYNNCFRYKHYLSAVKIYAFSENSPQSATMWGKIRKVIVRNQPHSCSVNIPSVSLPEWKNGTLHQPIERRTYGEAHFSKNDLTSFPLVKTPIFGDNTLADDMETVLDSPTLDGTSEKNKLYLGHALIAPQTDLFLDIHTDSGIYSVKVDWKQEEKDAAGHFLQTTEIFQPGYLYSILLDFGANNTISTLLLENSEGTYYDLTTGETFGDNSHQIYRYKTANSYIVNPSLQYTDPKGNKHYYDGFTFLANTIGNGEEGILDNFPQKNSRIHPVSAGLIWESKRGLVTQVEFLYDYIRFQVKPPTTEGEDFEEGNAVIAAYDENGKILWSWHIWITDEPQRYDIKSGNQIIGIMDRNLGATSEFASDKGGELSTYGLYYQWGRKDPSMPPPEANYRPQSTATIPYYDYYGNKLYHAGVIERGKPTIEDGIANPMFLILPTDIPPYYAYDWLYQRINTLWGSSDSDQKTIYDPCPFGYRVPGEELGSLLSKYFHLATLEGNAYIYNLTGSENQLIDIAFPLAGYKGVDRGNSSLTAAWKYVGEKGDYMNKCIYPEPNNHRGRTYLSKTAPWTEIGSASGNDGHGKNSFTYNNKIFTDFANRRTAASIRCVADISLKKMGQIFPFIDGPDIILLGDENIMDWGATSNGGRLDRITFTESRHGHNTYSRTVYPNSRDYKERHPLPGKNASAYNELGLYTYKIIAGNNMGIETNITKTIPVLNITELYDVRIEGEKPSSKFMPGSPKYLSFKVNMREAGTAGQAATSVADLKLLFTHTEIWIDGKYVDIEFDIPTKTFTASTPIYLNGDIIIEYRTKAGRVLKQYVMKMMESFQLGKQITNIKNIENEKYYGFVAKDENQKDLFQKRWWRLDNGEKLALSAPADHGGKLDASNLFKFHGKNTEAQIQQYGTANSLDEQFRSSKTGMIIYYEPYNNEPMIQFYQNLWWTHSAILYNEQSRQFGIENNGDATPWFIYEINPMISYAGPTAIP